MCRSLSPIIFVGVDHLLRGCTQVLPETAGIPFAGHAESAPAIASYDATKLRQAFESRQLLVSFDIWFT